MNNKRLLWQFARLTTSRKNQLVFLTLLMVTCGLFGFVTSDSNAQPLPSVNLINGFSATTTPAYPLKRSDDVTVRYLVDQNNQPFFIVGEAAWSLIGQVSLEDAQLYLDDLAAKGFNTVITTLVEGYYAVNAPANYYGVQPYIPANNFSSPNDAYFAHADAVINYAAAKGILVILSPNYLGCCNDGWRNALENQNTMTDAANFGTYVGNRYKNFPNLIYAWGNDMNPDTTNVRDKIDAMATATRLADPNHLHTFHAAPEFSAWEIGNAYNYTWIDFNAVYSYNPVQAEVASNYDPDNNPNTPPPLPLFLFESHYENDWGGRNALITRRQGYVAVLTGASGYAYGNNPMWHMNGHPSWITTDWHLHLEDEGRADMAHFQALFSSRNWAALIPDANNTLVTGNKGTGENYSAAAVTADHGTAIIYFPQNKTITVAMNQISGSTANVWWFNPRTGAAQSGGSFATTGSRQFAAPTNNDWLLVLDNADLNLPAPGQMPQPTPTNTPISPTATQPTTPPGPTLTPANTVTPTLPPTFTFTPTPTNIPVSTVTTTPSNTPPVQTPTNTPLPGSGFPATGILDNFNRNNGPLGPNWSGQTSGHSIVSNQLDVGNSEDIYWNSTVFGSDQEAYITLTTIDQNGDEIGLILKSQSNTNITAMIAVVYNPIPKRVQVWTYSGSQGWVQRGGNFPVAFVNGDQFGARATATGLVEVYRNSTLLTTQTVTDWSHYSGSGYIGIFPLSASNAILDDFGGGTRGILPTATTTPILPTNTPTAVPTNTPIPSTATLMPPTVSPTNTPLPPTATFTPTPATISLLYVSSTTSGSVGGISFANEDILITNLATGDWSLYFDGSDVGLGGTDVNAFSLLTDGTILLSLNSTTYAVPGLGTVENRDIIRFLPTTLGTNTSGSFVWYFDGSDVGLANGGENIDVIAFAPDGRLLISTTGNFSVPGVSGGDEDIIAFTASQWGSTTAGTFAFYFDGSDVALNTTSSEDINGLWVDTANNQLYLSTVGAFAVPGVSGDGADIFICTPGTLGMTTTCTFTLFWDGSLNGLSGQVLDAIEIVP